MLTWTAALSQLYGFRSPDRRKERENLGLCWSLALMLPPFAFTRFYTRKVGVVDGMASHPFSLAEARVLYEARSPRPANSYPHPQGAWA